MGENLIHEQYIDELKDLVESLDSSIDEFNPVYSNENLNELSGIYNKIKIISDESNVTMLSSFLVFIGDYISGVIDNGVESPDTFHSLLKNSTDWIRISVFESRDEEELIKIRDSIIELLQGSGGRVHETAGEDLVTGEFYYRIQISFDENISSRGIDPLLIISDLCNLGEIVKKKVNTDSLPDITDIDPEKVYGSWDIVLKTKKTIHDIEDVFMFVQDSSDIDIEDVTAGYDLNLNEALFIEENKLGDILVNKGLISEEQLNEVLEKMGRKNIRTGDFLRKKGYVDEDDIDEALLEQRIIREKLESDTVRVDSSKLDSLMGLLGEIVIGQAAAMRIADEIIDEKSAALKNSLFGLDRSTREFQELLMAIRMVPVGPILEKIKNGAVKSSKKEGKEIAIELKGSETELDRTVVQKISEPLKYMISNVISRSIESPDDREKSGKEKQANIIINIYQLEGYVNFDISDDGLGLETCDFNNDDSDYSNIDAVKADIEVIKGTIELVNSEIYGCILRLKIPLAMAIIEGMLISVGEHRYIIPLLSIVESLQPKKEDVKTVEGKGEVVLVRGDYVSLVRIHDIFDIEPIHTEPWNALVMIVESGGEKIGLMIDDLIGQQQIVIKSLEKDIVQSQRLSGAAILGDGEVVLIIDIQGLIQEMTRVAK